MAAKLPYMMSTGLIPKILEKIQNARRPDRFTQDFLETKLGHSGGSARSIIPLLKRMGFLGSDGVPSSLYDQFRNTDTQGLAVAVGMKNAFGELFDRNEYVYELPREKLNGLIIEITGGQKDDRTTVGIVGTFLALKELADFDGSLPDETMPDPVTDVAATIPASSQDQTPSSANKMGNVGLRIGYTINLNLPESTDPAVFNAIFRALRENLLRN